MGTKQEVITRIAQTGFTAKGIVYILVGILAFMAAFELGGQDENSATRTGVFEWLQDTGGKFLLGLIAIGLLSYVLFRFVQSFSGYHEEKAGKRIMYFFSGLAYASVAFTAISMIMKGQQNNGDKNQQLASDLMNKPMGDWLMIIAAIIFTAIGIYQLYYAFAQKYKDHVQKLELHSDRSKFLLRMGKIGYIARGIVWLLVAFLFSRAAMHHNASEAGDTGKAFNFIEQGYMGSYILGAIGLGLLAYGIFSVTRARYERF